MTIKVCDRCGTKTKLNTAVIYNWRFGHKLLFFGQKKELCDVCFEALCGFFNNSQKKKYEK
jgi:hypothetical protein